MGKSFLITETQLRGIIKNELKSNLKSSNMNDNRLVRESHKGDGIVLNENYIRKIVGPFHDIVKVSNLSENVNIALIRLPKSNNRLKNQEYLKKVVKTLKEHKDNGIISNFVITSDRKKVSLFFKSKKPIV